MSLGSGGAEEASGISPGLIGVSRAIWSAVTIVFGVAFA